MRSAFQPNSIVRVVAPLMEQMGEKGHVLRGALAVVVDGTVEFPHYYNELCNLFGSSPEINDFIFVKWIREDPRWKGRIDGAYSAARFEEVSGGVPN